DRTLTKRAVQLFHQLCGFLPRMRSDGQFMDLFDHALDAFLRSRCPRRAWPVLGEYIRPNVYPRKSNSPSGTLQIRVLPSFTVSFNLPMISRSRCNASSAVLFRHRITRSSA